MNEEGKALVAVIMGSKSDWAAMQHTAALLSEFEVPHECRVLSAHRAPRETAAYAAALEGRGVEVVIAGAGGAAHLAGTVAANTLLPVIGVPLDNSALGGMDSLLSTAQMPAGIPVATMSIGEAGAKNAALLAVAILARHRPQVRNRLQTFRDKEKDLTVSAKLP